MNKFSYIIISLLILGLLFINVIFPKYSYVTGKQCLYNADLKCAVSKLHIAYIHNPLNTDYEYYYAKALTQSKPEYEIQKSIYNLYKKAKSDSAKNLLKSRLNEIKSEILSSIGNNYIGQVPSDTEIIRWDINSFPLNVFIDSKTDIPDYYTFTIKRALALWAKSVNFIDFNIIKNKSNAQIIIKIEQLPDDICQNYDCKYMLGYTKPIISGHTLRRMEITLYNKNPKGEYFSDKEIFNTVLHELGHSLGIMGHSYNRDDLMYPSQKEKNNLYDKYRGAFHLLTGHDINTIILLYKLEPTITNKVPDKRDLIYAPIILGDNENMLNKKIKEANNYIKNTPNLSAGYINLAGAYLQKGEYKLAEENLIQAEAYAKSKDEKYIIYYNMSLIKCKMKNFKQAQQYIDKAKQIKDSPELTEIENLIKNKIVPTF